MWVLLVIIGWIGLELLMARLASESGPEIHSITTLELNKAAPQCDTEQKSTVDG